MQETEARFRTISMKCDGNLISATGSEHGIEKWKPRLAVKISFASGISLISSQLFSVNIARHIRANFLQAFSQDETN